MRYRGSAVRRLSGVAVFGTTAVIAAGGATASTNPDTLGQTTVQQRILPNADPDFRELALGAGEPYTVREEGVGVAQAGRDNRRASLLYFGQLTDFQLADEEPPSRVEFIDAGPASAAWRPWEALNPHIDDAMIRQINEFADASPVADGAGAVRPMDFTIATGDNADSQQLNETEWVRTLLEGGTLTPGSGINPTGYVHPLCPAPVAAAVADGTAPQNYTGVQDYDDYNEGAAPQFYDPDVPSSAFAAWPEYDGLMDRAQQAFDAAGLDVPSYVVLGNHDGLVQGNQSANASIEDVATGCIKITSPVTADPGSLSQAFGALNPANLLSLLASDPGKLGFVPPDPKRQYVSTKQYREVFLAGSQSDGHGFAFSDPDQLDASGGAVGYYAWSPRPGFRFIGLNTVSEAGVTGPSADGNVDDPQFRWLEQQLQDATAADELVVIFSHHAIPSLTADLPDEAAGSCTGNDEHGHGNNPGCDVDPRDSAPIHLGADLEELLLQYPHVVAWVAGHSHLNSIEPYPNPAGGGFWSIRVAAEADWPQQTRLLEVFDNKDETLSIFGTIVDHASDATAPASGAAALGMSPSDLASVGRTLSANDPQGGIGTGEGDPADRNVELLVADPRDGGGGGGSRCLNLIEGTPGKDEIDGTPGPDRLRGREGRDLLRGKAGDDCVAGGDGRYRVSGGADEDRLRGGRRRDRLAGGRGFDLLFGGPGLDRLSGGGGQDQFRGGAGGHVLNAADGVPESVRCGRGQDVATLDAVDVPKGCERVVRR